jgi:uncharacterized alkaline shock family protein YloU
LIDIRTGFEYNDSIETIFKMAFWDNLYYNFYDNIAIIFSVLEHIIVLYLQLIPNRLDMHENFKNVINIEFIKYMFEHNAFDNTEFEKLTRFIIAQIHELDSTIGQQQLTKFINNFDVIIKYGYTINEILPYIFRNIINHMEMLILTVDNIKS